MENKYKLSEVGVLAKSHMENSILMDIPLNDADLIISGEKTVIVQRKLPAKTVVSQSILLQRHPKVYLYTKSKGVFGECICGLSYDNIDNEVARQKKVYTEYGRVEKMYRDMYKSDPNSFANELERLNSHINLNGTCLSYEEFRNHVGIGNYIFFVIKSFVLYDKPLQLQDFYIARVGKNGLFSPSEKFKCPRGWCYAVSKNNE